MLTLNGESMQGLLHSEAVTLFKSVRSGAVTLEVSRRDPAATSRPSITRSVGVRSTEVSRRSIRSCEVGWWSLVTVTGKGMWHYRLMQYQRVVRTCWCCHQWRFVKLSVLALATATRRQPHCRTNHVVTEEPGLSVSTTLPLAICDGLSSNYSRAINKKR